MYSTLVIVRRGLGACPSNGYSPTCRLPLLQSRSVGLVLLHLQIIAEQISFSGSQPPNGLKWIRCGMGIVNEVVDDGVLYCSLGVLISASGYSSRDRFLVISARTITSLSLFAFVSSYLLPYNRFAFYFVVFVAVDQHTFASLYC